MRKSYISGDPGGGGAGSSSLLLFCAQRRSWAVNLAQALLLLLILAGVAGLGVAVAAYVAARAPVAQNTYTQDVPRLPADPSSHVAIGGATPLTFTLPNDLSGAYVGRTYNWDCVGPLGLGVRHTLRIEAGPLPTRWPGTNATVPPQVAGGGFRSATCTAAGGGMTWRVVTPQLVRIISVTPDVVFSDFFE
jgi:hypothetical protein